MNPSTAEAAVLIDELIAGGVSDAVLAPGSRSAPLAFALYAAERAGRITLHVRTDERTAAFLALGLARATGRPAPIVTTSGTAVANLHPAVLEAHHDGVPLVVLTADRPPRLRGVGANQTATHMTMFAAETLRYRVELGVAQRISGQNGYWRGQVCRVLAAAAGAFHSGRGGPVHLNVPFGVPLVPDGDADEYDAVLAGGDSGTDGARPDWPESLTGRAGPWTDLGGPGRGGALAEAFPIEPPREGEKCLFVASLTHLLARDIVDAGYLVVSEAGGVAGESVLAAGEHLLADAEFMAAHRPDRVIVLGRPTLFRSVTTLLDTTGVTVDVVDHPASYSDTRGVVHAVAPSMGAVGPAEKVLPLHWVAAWRDADAAAQQAISQVLATEVYPSSAAVVRAVTSALPGGAMLVVGSSQTPRDIGRYTVARNGIRIVANRGVAGIDGTVSTAIGVALARAAVEAGPTYAVMGDLTFLHDVTGLAIGRYDRCPAITIVVINNDGGGIFSTLEQGAPAHRAAFERVFGTPTGARIGSIVEGLGAQYQAIDSCHDLADAVARPPRGLRVVEVRTSRGELRERDYAVAAAVHRELGSAGLC